MNALAYQEQHSLVLDKQYFNFAAAHFLIFADGEREPLHGHNYRAELELHADLGDASLVADFIAVKPLFKAACDELDHRTLLPRDNERLFVWVDDRVVEATWGQDVFRFPRADVVLLDGDNTSSEALAQHLCERFLAHVAEAIPELRLQRVDVTVSESPGQAARYTRTWHRPMAYGAP